MIKEEFTALIKEDAKQRGKDYYALTDAQFRRIVIDHFLGKDWYVVGPMAHEQINVEAMAEIISRYPEPLLKRIKRRIAKKLLPYISKASRGER